MKTNMNVHVINGRQDFESKRRQDMLDVLDTMRHMVQSGEITEFVSCSVDEDGIAQIHICAMDLPGSIGMFEIGKHLLIAGETSQFE